MSRLIVFAVIAVVIVWLLRRAVRRAGARRGAAQSEDGGRTLVACAHCGTHVPGHEAVRVGNLAYCGQAHASLGPRTP